MLEWAKKELKFAGLYDKDADYGGMIPDAVTALLEVFSEQGHSGGSASIVAELFYKLSKMQPITPLTGEPDEWFFHDENFYQNIRCGNVFKDGNGAYDIDGIVFVSKGDGSFTSSRCGREYITFPYTPTTKYIHEGTPEAEPFKDIFK